MESIHKDKLEALSNDKNTLEALRQSLTEIIERHKPNITEINSDKAIGEKYRAYIKAKEILESFLYNIESYKQMDKGQEPLNKGK